MLFAVAVATMAVFSGLGDVPFPVPPGKLTAIITRAGDLPQKQGHVQGICVGSNAVYMTILKGIHKFDWKGHLVKSVDCKPHVGDICLWNGRLYTANCAGNNTIAVYDEDLNFIRSAPTERGADGIACIDGTLYVGLGPVRDPARPYRGNWFCKYDAETLKPLCKPFAVDHGSGTWLGVQNIATDGRDLYVGLYTPTEDEPNFIRFDRDFKVKGAWRLGVGQGIDVIGGAPGGAVRFVHAWTVFGDVPQAILRFAELKGNALSDLTKYETCAYERLRERTVLDDLMPQPVKTEIVRYPHAKLPKSRLDEVKVVTGPVPGAPAATADEAYVLEISGNGVTVTAPGPRGERWARGTLAQLRRLSQTDSVPCCRITDWPHLKWRGFMLDTSRNYLPIQGIKDVLDVMSIYKLNLFHWHLTENYAWRLESKKYPQLQSDAAFLFRHRGRYYTQDDFREIVAYAKKRGITVMPELDVPGHSFAFRKAFGFRTMRDPGVDRTVADLLAELCSLVPKEDMPFVHIGTDEVWKRDIEGAAPEALDLWAKTVADAGRTIVSWTPGETYGTPGPRVNMLWTREADAVKTPGPYFDAYGMYIEDMDPFELLPHAVYWQAATRWEKPGRNNLGAIFCAWHDGAVGEPYENLLRNQQILPSCALFGDAFWHGREHHLPQYRTRLPLADDPLITEAEDIERRMVAQRDRMFADYRHPFHFLRQTDMRWRLSYADGRIAARNIAQATITPFRTGSLQENFFDISNGTVVAETWIRSPVDQTVGAWIGFTSISRDHGLVYASPLPDRRQWNRFGAKAELNCEPIAPPDWKRPGLGMGKPVEGAWNEIWTLYEADEEPFTDQEYFMREPTPINLKAGWNHVKLTIPYPGRVKGSKQRPRWVATFIPVLGPTDHPREVPGLEYSCDPR